MNNGNDFNSEKEILHLAEIESKDDSRLNDPISTVTTSETFEDIEINPAAAALIEQHGAPGERGETTLQDNPNTFTIDSCFQNTSENPYRETTVTVPYLLRKVPSEDLVPPGWSSINRIIAASYFSMICCLITGVFANHFAWEAKTDRSRGLYTLVQRDTKYAVGLIYLSVAIGVVLIIVIPIAIVCGVHGC